jgi:hypothetical protein
MMRLRNTASMTPLNGGGEISDALTSKWASKNSLRLKKIGILPNIAGYVRKNVELVLFRTFNYILIKLLKILRMTVLKKSKFAVRIGDVVQIF